MTIVLPTDIAQQLAPQTAVDAAALVAVGVASAMYLLRGIAWDRPDPYHHLLFERPTEKVGGTGSAKAKATRNIAEKLEQSDKNLVIFWGSQSGTAEVFAARLAKECHLRFGLHPLTADLSDYDPHTIGLLADTKLAIFIMSTYGEGDPSDNTAAFWEWLHETPSPGLQLPNLRYMAFGLGNSNYRYYNRVIDVVTDNLDKAGAQRLMPVGKADDVSGGTEEDFLSWKDSLFNVFRETLKLQEKVVSYAPSITVVEDESVCVIELNLGEPTHSRTDSSNSPVCALAVKSANELCASSSRSCIHMELDIAGNAELRYRTGDHLVIYPINPENEVEILLAAIGFDQKRAQKPLLIQHVEGGDKIKIPTPTTLSALMRYYLEVCAPVSRETVRSLGNFAPSAEAAKFLSSLTEDKHVYASFTSRNHVTLGRILSLAAPSAIWERLPLSFLVEAIPLVRPRLYSISSSSVVTPRRIAITASVECTPLASDSSTEIRGVTSNYLSSLANSLNQTPPAAEPGSRLPRYSLSGPRGALEGHKLYACVRQSSFRLPVQSSTPLIMIGAGTGIAPFRAFVMERARLKSIGKPAGRMLLFFGCRKPEEDYLYREELAEAVASMDGLLEIIPAFSRLGAGSKTYVQDRVAEMEKVVCAMLQDNASMYICGRVTMAKKVGEVVQESMKKLNGWDDAETRRWIETTKKRSKWLEDVWG
ncbi:NADPH--cytochrome P450 reductase [Tolypocladium paradoxum]|uniref:NADPH--cytochrome P450 reductase n=1 Tax=Tolypocladium paradoxum TaxID=94208 RepID=A0A2S4KLU5_9HYPO|nr:NADPH--cytochrome P450 reductase [Tolypocladium paradoxum]